MKKYSIFHLPLFAFFSKRLYREVACNWKGANLAYLFLLLAVCWIPPTLSMRDTMVKSLESSQLGIINQLPPIHIVNGRVAIDQKQPHYIRKANGTPVAIIDTTGSMNYIDEASVLALLTETELIVRSGKNRFNTLDLSQISDFHIDKFVVNNWLQTTKNSIAPLSYGIFLMLSYIFTVLVLLLLAIFGLVVSTAAHVSLKFAAIWRIAVAAATPAIILFTASAALGKSIPAPAFVAVTLVYLFLGIKACMKKPEEQILRLTLKDLIHEEAA